MRLDHLLSKERRGRECLLPVQGPRPPQVGSGLLKGGDTGQFCRFWWPAQLVRPGMPAREGGGAAPRVRGGWGTVRAVAEREGAKHPVGVLREQPVVVVLVPGMTVGCRVVVCGCGLVVG